MSRKFTLAILVFDGYSQLDFTAVSIVFKRLGVVEIRVVGESPGIVTSDLGLSFEVTQSIHDLNQVDAVFIPGGDGIFELLNHAELIAKLEELAANSKYTYSNGTGSFLLAATGLLNGKRAATHWAYSDLMTEFEVFPVFDQYVLEDKIITGAGAGAAMDMTLLLISQLFGRPHAEYVQLSLEYVPSPPFDSGTIRTADPKVAMEIRSSANAVAARKIREFKQK